MILFGGNLGSIDFDSISSTLLNKSQTILPEWFPQGKLIGKEFAVGSLQGDIGQSLRINTITGIWKDFATGDSGSDLVSLYAAVHGIGQGDAAKKLSTGWNGNGGNGNGPIPTNGWKSKPAEFIIPPEDMPAPDFTHSRYGNPTNIWTYRDADNKRLGYVARYDDDSGKKHFCPFSATAAGWVKKALPLPRPLYDPNWSNEARHPDGISSKPVLLVEGEKAADAAHEICGAYYRVLTWPGGAEAYRKVDWSPAYGTNILIWPDADPAGQKCAEGIARLLTGHCPEISIIDVTNRNDGWDAADALSQGMTTKNFVDWVAEKRKKPVSIEVVTDEPKEESNATSMGKGVWAHLGLTIGTSKEPVNNLDNIVRILETDGDWKQQIWYDEFHDKIFIKENDAQREWSDVDTLRLTQEFQRALVFSRLSKETVDSGVKLYADNNRRNEPKDWLESIEWDKKFRIESFFKDYLGAKNNEEYLQCASKNFWVSMCARVYRPGCKVDAMPILQGGQGTLKSTALQTIGGKWFSEAHESPTSKDFYLVLQGKILVEISELSSFSGAEVGKIKQVITCQVDRFRKPYGKCAEDHPRKCVFVGTTNDDAYLKDPTGGRRFWPVTIGKIDIKRIEADREQLFAEAVLRFKQNDNWWLMPEKETLDVQEEYRASNPWEEKIENFLRGKLGGVSILDIAKSVLDLDPRDVQGATMHRLGDCLRALGWEKKVRRNALTGKSEKRWFLISE